MLQSAPAPQVATQPPKASQSTSQLLPVRQSIVQLAVKQVYRQSAPVSQIA